MPLWVKHFTTNCSEVWGITQTMEVLVTIFRYIFAAYIAPCMNNVARYVFFTCFETCINFANILGFNNIKLSYLINFTDSDFPMDGIG